MNRPLLTLIVAGFLSCSVVAFAGGSADSGAAETTAAVRTGQSTARRPCWPPWSRPASCPRWTSGCR